MKPQHTRFNFLLQIQVLTLVSDTYSAVQSMLQQYPMLKTFIER